jgi:DNA transformation protein
MASDLNFVQFLGDQLQTLAPVTWRKMFGEFALYHHGKVVALVCDNQVWLKPTAQAEQIVPRVIWGHAYPGSKPYLQITDWVDERELLADLIRTTAAALPEPAPKVPKAPKAAKKAPSATPRAPKTTQRIADLPNLGPKSADMLRAAGVTSLAELQALGAVRAYVRVKRQSPRASLNLLWALEGALTGMDWKDVAREHRTSLLLAVEELIGEDA